tara:strand:- start:14636 stop:15271 length:636 start_codon:yes stop_codon:yes gene_type:complete
MLLVKQIGANSIDFCGDRHQLPYFNQGIAPIGAPANSNVSFAIVFTNDMTRESMACEFIRTTTTNQGTLNVIKYVDGKFTCAFKALSLSSTPDGSLGQIVFPTRGYYSYVIYQGTVINNFPPASAYLSHKDYLEHPALLPREIDRGKALVVTTDQFNAIKTGTTNRDVNNAVVEYLKRDRDLLDGEVAYTKHTDKITSSDIDADNNFINVN